MKRPWTADQAEKQAFDFFDQVVSMPLCEPIVIGEDDKKIEWIREIDLDDLAIERNGKSFSVTKSTDLLWLWIKIKIRQYLDTP